MRLKTAFGITATISLLVTISIVVLEVDWSYRLETISPDKSGIQWARLAIVVFQHLAFLLGYWLTSHFLIFWLPVGCLALGARFLHVLENTGLLHGDALPMRALRNPTTQELSLSSPETAGWVKPTALMWLAGMPGVLLGGLIMYGAFQDNPQGEYYDPYNGGVAWAYSYSLFVGWFTAVFVVLAMPISCIALSTRLLRRRLSHTN